jgi:hypothetical protein
MRFGPPSSSRPKDAAGSSSVPSCAARGLGAGGLGYGITDLQDETDHIRAAPFFPNNPPIRITMTRCKELLANNGTVGDLVAEFGTRLGIKP